MSLTNASEQLAALLGSCLRALTQLEGTERALVLTQEPGEGPTLRGLHGNLDPADLASKEAPPGFALHVVSTDKKAIHSLDITQDPAFAACVRRSEGRSMLCVPITGPEGICGYLYADHTFKAGAFPHADLRKIESHASELGPQLQAALAAARLAPKQSLSTEHVTALRAGAGLVALAVIWWGLGVVIHARARPPAPPPPPSITTAAPQVVAASYVSMVRFKQLDGAYDMLSTRQKKRIPKQKYNNEMAAWLLDKQNSWDIELRRAGAAVVTGRRADVVIQPAPGTKAWNYRLVQEEDGGSWKLDRWDTGPFKESWEADVRANPSPSPFIIYKDLSK